MTWKHALPILVAFAFGALIIYAIMSRSERAEEWALTVVSDPHGIRVYGFFETREECHGARAGLVETVLARNRGMVRRGRQTLFTASEGIYFTFSCLPLSEVRGLSLTPPPSDSN